MLRFPRASQAPMVSLPSHNPIPTDNKGQIFGGHATPANSLGSCVGSTG
jgi:hypothetical protein